MSTTRAELARKQASIVSALMTDHVTADLGIKESELHRGRRILRNKRMQVVRRSHPRLQDILGIEFEQLFEEYATKTPLNEKANGNLDGRKFTNYLLLASELCFSKKIQLINHSVRK